ncbi:MAG: hypothetical protein ACE5H9_14725 [Anaerolineae bacterium]
MPRGRLILLAAISLILALALRGPVTLAAPPAQGDVGVITEPAENAVVRGVVEIEGTAVHPAFQFYKVELAREPNTDDQWVIIGSLHEEQVLNGVLEVWDTTQWPDGSYTLRLRVVRNDGNYTEFFSRQVVIANTQPTETPTPEASITPTITPTPLPPTPTVVIDQPVIDTPTPRLLPTPESLPTVSASASGLPSISFDFAPLQAACVWGGGTMLGVFFLFGFLSALRTFIKGFIDRLRGR